MMKKMNKKGFTLIELLAIIVILAIIAVITVPIILNVIDNAKLGSAKNSVIGYGKAIELAYTQKLYDDNLNGGTASVDGEEVSVNISNASGATSTTATLNVVYEGTTVTCAEDGVSLVAGKLTMTGCTVDGYDGATFTYTSGEVTVDQ